VKIDHDVHIHTNLSSCSHDPTMDASAVIDRAARLGLGTVGFANHLWDRAVDGASDWYAPQDLDHVLSIREQIPAETRGIRVLVGCETEYCGGGKVGISPAAAERLDYVLIPHSHFHMPGFTVPADLSAPDDVARLLVRRFVEVLDLQLATGIAHPFLTLGFETTLGDILSRISDEQFSDCFGRAAEARVSIEVHREMFPGPDGAEKGFDDETFLRILSLAKRAGCFFHFTSDAHHIDTMDTVLGLEPYTEALGITPEDIHPAFRSPAGPQAPK